MIHTIARRKGTRYAVAYRPGSGKVATTRTFADPDAAEAFDRYANTRWPLDPLVRACGYDPDSPTGIEDWASAHRISTREMGYAQRDGGLTDHQADQWATRAHLNPTEIWGRDWDDTGLALAHIHPDEPEEPAP